MQQILRKFRRNCVFFCYKSKNNFTKKIKQMSFSSCRRNFINNNVKTAVSQKQHKMTK